MIYITEEEKSKIKYNGWDKIVNLKINNKSYYAKFIGTAGAFRELLGKKIFDMLGISTPDYLYLRDKNCILSTDLREQYQNFIFGYELTDIINMNDLYEIVRKYKNSEELITTLNILHFIDILFSNTDRHSNNYGFSINEDGNAKLVVLDNEEMLDDFIHATRPVSFPTKDHLCFIDFTKESEYKYFLDTLSEEQKQVIYYLLQKFDLKTVFSLINEIERENGIRLKNKRKILLNYIKNYIMIYKNTLNDRKNKTKKTTEELKQKIKL